jgi:hypothetical protein
VRFRIGFDHRHYYPGVERRPDARLSERKLGRCFAITDISLRWVPPTARWHFSGNRNSRLPNLTGCDKAIERVQLV